MTYTGKYAKMADDFRRDGADEHTIEKWIREEMERDEFHKGDGTTDLAAWKIWKSWPEMRRQMYLQHAFCASCGSSSFAPGFNVRQDRYGLIVQGTCSKCGGKISRACD